MKISVASTPRICPLKTGGPRRYNEGWPGTGSDRHRMTIALADRYNEGMNLASVWRLPVIFLCENNQFGEYTPFRKVTAGESIALRATGFGLPGAQVDGNDVLAVADKVSEAVQRARQGEGPSLIECITYRYYGHHSGDPGTRYREADEVKQWKSRDPIELFGQWLTTERGVRSDYLQGIRAAVENEIAAAVAFGVQSPLPEVSEVTHDVYA